MSCFSESIFERYEIVSSNEASDKFEKIPTFKKIWEIFLSTLNAPSLTSHLAPRQPSSGLNKPFMSLL